MVNFKRCVAVSKVCYAVGDIHGKYDLLINLQSKIAAHAADFDEKKIVYLGDYIDRGDKSSQVVDHLINQPMEGFTEVHIIGNHELFMLSSAVRPDEGTMGSWMVHGGYLTMMSYDCDMSKLPRLQEFVMEYNGKFPGVTRSCMSLIQSELTRCIPQSHMAFFRELAYSHLDDGHLFVHAGINPYAPIDQQDENDLCWIREPFLTSQRDYGVIVVHGHSISPNVEFRDNRIGCDTGAYSSGKLSAVAITPDGYEVINT